MASLEKFEDGCRVVERTGNQLMLANLNAIYGLAIGGGAFQQPVSLDALRYAMEAVRIADAMGDIAIRAGTRAALAWVFLYFGQLQHAERTANEAIALAAGDPHRGADVVGISPLLAARNVQLHARGSTREPLDVLREYPRARQAAIESGFPENVVYCIAMETELRYALRDTNGLHALAQTAVSLASNLGTLTEVVATIATCDVLAADRDWHTLRQAAIDLIGRLRAYGIGQVWEPRLLALLGTAELESGNPRAGRAAAQEGVAFMRESQSTLNPHCFAVFARAQLALEEPALDVAATLDDYEALLTRTGFRIYEGELNELRAELAGREGQQAEQAVALAQAHDCYVHFGMLAHAQRLEGMQAHRANT